MKEIDQVPAVNANRLFETPQKKDRPLKKCSEGKGAEGQQLNPDQRFDLSESPRFKVSTDIQIEQNQSLIKQPVSYSVKKQYYSPPIVVKIENNPISTINKFINSRRKKRPVRISYREMRLKANFIKCYGSIIRRIQEDEHVEIPESDVMNSENEEERTYSQLLTFALNQKNSRKLVYSKRKHTLVPIYECFGCRTQFSNSPALGGHLRSCVHKLNHYKMLEMYHKACQTFIQNSSQSFSQQDMKKQDDPKQSEFKTPVKNPQMNDSNLNQQTEKQKEAQSIFCSSEEKSMSKSVRGQENHFDQNVEKIENQESDKDEGCRDDSEEYDPSEERTVRKQRMTRKRAKELRDKAKTRFIQKNKAQQK